MSDDCEPSTLSEDNDTLILELDRGEASALSYFVAFAALSHERMSKLTSHEDSLITKVSKLDPDGYELWRESVMRAARDTK